VRRCVMAAAVAVSGTLSVAACSSSAGGPPADLGNTHGSPSSPSRPTRPASSGAATAFTDADAHDSLLTARQVGAGFRAMPSDDTGQPLPCEQQAPPLDRQFQPSAKAKTDLVARDGKAYLSEEVIGYHTAATANHALAAGERGFSCRAATVQVNGKPVRYRIQPAQDITANVGVPVDKAMLWRVRTSIVNIQLVAVKIGAQLVVISFAAPPGADTSDLPNPASVLRAALTKVKAHIPPG
jgi:hypothetical protein